MTSRRLSMGLSMLIVLLCMGRPPQAFPLTLEHIARYNAHASTYHDHLMAVEPVGQHHALVGSNLDLVIVDLDALPPQGTEQFAFRLAGIDVHSMVARDDGWVFVNLRLGGLAVVYYDESATTLTLVTTLEEPGVFYEKMELVDDRLYVAAHAHGIRIFDVQDAANPILVGSLASGFDDAFAIAVDGDTAYVADGAGGLKVVDISGETSPVIVGGQDPHTADGGAQDVLVSRGQVYVACGAAGVAFFKDGDLAGGTLYDTPRTAKHLALVGDHLAVADIGGLELFAVAPDGALSHVAAERGQRRSYGGTDVTLRLWHGVSAWGSDRVLAANWDSMDVYRLVDPAVGTQPDVIVSTNRLRFAPWGGAAVVDVANTGAAPLWLTDIHSTEPSFTVSPTAAILQPGESLDLAIEYAGGLPGEAVVFIESNDPDEAPLPIQVYGETEFLDPGEPAIPFNVESWNFDHENRQFTYGTFDLTTHAGQIVFFHVYGLG